MQENTEKHSKAKPEKTQTMTETEGLWVYLDGSRRISHHFVPVFFHCFSRNVDSHKTGSWSAFNAGMFIVFAAKI